MPDSRPVTFAGRESRNAPLRERVWRGGAPDAGGDLVVFLAETACSDGMSDTVHPVTARVSLPDGRFLAGCCRVPAAATGGTAAGPDLEGETWRLVSASGIDPSTLGSSRRPVTVSFDGERVAGFSGCNQFGGSYELEGERLTLGQLVATRMACAEPAMSLESAFHEDFAGALRATRAGDRLELVAEPADDAAATWVFEAVPRPALEGPTWEVAGFDNGRSVFASPSEGTRITLSFRDGEVAGSSGCNAFRAPYQLEGPRLELQLLAGTKRMCPGEGVMEQEQQFLAALQKSALWEIRGEVLELFAAGGARVLTARPAP